jgi:murein DD-endopeptidase MepM/ murein hydrolase activator NlpD
MIESSFMNPVLGHITGKWGERIHPVTRKKSFHSGVDLGVPEGTQIKAPANGKVILVDKLDDDSGGLQLKIQHHLPEGDFITGYAHLKGIEVSLGMQVNKGDIIAISGHTGIGTGPHLHFTLRTGILPHSATIDPLLYFDFKS